LVVNLLSYYISHKPFGPDQAVGLGRALWQIFCTSSLLILAGAVGRRFAPVVDIHPLARLSLQGALGYGMLGFAVFGVGLLGGLRFWIGVLLLAAGLLYFRREVGQWLADFCALIDLWRESDRWGRFMAIGIFFILWFTFLVALAPPLKFDALVYHLALPKQYISEGQITYIPEIMFWGMPQNGEMIYTWAMLIAGDQAAALSGWFFGFLTLLGLAGLIRQYFEASAVWAGLGSLLAGFSLAAALSWGYVDWLAMLFGISTLLALDQWRRSRQHHHLLLAGVLAGMAVGVKYTAGVILPGCFVAIFLISRQEQAGIRFWRRVGWFTIMTGLLVFPWLLRNWFATGSPIYPLLVPAGAMSPLRVMLYQSGQAWGNWLDAIILPLRATFFGSEQAAGYSSAIGALLVGLSLPAWLGRSFLGHTERQITSLAAWLVIPGLIIWMILGRFTGYLLQSRLYFVFFPAASLLAAVGFICLNRITGIGFRVGWVTRILVALALFMNVFEVGLYHIRLNPQNYLMGLQSSDEYLAQNLGWTAPAFQSLSKLPDQSRVLLLWETRSLYCQRSCDPDEVLDRWLVERYSRPDQPARAALEIRQGWLQEGYSHLLLHKAGLDYIRQNAATSSNYSLDDWNELDRLLSDLELIESFGEAYLLYIIK
jgi:hypothetical protein